MNGIPAGEKPVYRLIDLTRALAAAAVVWNHCFNMLLEPLSYGSGWIYHALAISASFGRDAVMIFFVISGYWITRSVTGSVARGVWSWRNYLVSRLSRLWIVLIPALALGLALDVTGRFVLDVPPYRALWFMGTNFVDVGRQLSVSAAFGNALFLQDLLVPPLGSNSPLWSLSKEFWYYVWFPALLLAARRRPNWPALAATAVTLYLSGASAVLFLCWLAGSVVAWWDMRRASTAQTAGPWRPCCVAAAVLFWLVCSVAARTRGLGYNEGCLLISGGYAVLLATILRFDVGVPRFVGVVVWYGAHASYSLYAYHLPVLVAMIAIICGSGPLPLTPANVALATLVWLTLIAGGALFARATEARTPWLRARLMALLTPRRKGASAT